MRVAVYLLAALVFAGGLIVDTGALLALAGGFVWAHALAAAAAGLLAMALVTGWRRLRRRRGQSKPVRAGPTQRQMGPRQRRSGNTRTRNRTVKRARAK
jgi:hypothetical protein